jgi:predicted small metal-binding protein
VSLPERTGVAASEWDAPLAAVFADHSLLRLVFQPIVDLQRGTVAGYETLARFSTPDGRPSQATPDRWFAAADAVGRGASPRRSSSGRPSPSLPPNCFRRTTGLPTPEVSHEAVRLRRRCPPCGRTFTAPTDDDILAAVAGHARDSHGLTDIPAGLVDQVRAHIHTA